MMKKLGTIYILNSIYYPINLNSPFIKGGVESFCRTSYNVLKSIGKDVKIISLLDEENHPDIIKINYFSKSFEKENNLKQRDIGKALKECLDQIDFKENDLIFSQVSNSSLLNVILTLNENIPVLQMCHLSPSIYGIVQYEISSCFKKIMERNRGLVCSVSPVNSRIYPEVYPGSCDPRFHIWHTIIDGKEELRKSEDFVTFVGRCSEEKKILLVAKIFSQIDFKSHIFTNFNPCSDKEIKVFEVLQEILKGTSNVNLNLGKRKDEILDYQSRSLLGLNLSPKESLCEVVFDFARFGVPVIFQYKNNSENKVREIYQPEVFLNYDLEKYGLNTYKMKESKVIEEMVKRINNIEILQSERESLFEYVKNKFTKENWIKNFDKVINEIGLKI